MSLEHVMHTRWLKWWPHLVWHLSRGRAVRAERTAVWGHMHGSQWLLWPLQPLSSSLRERHLQAQTTLIPDGNQTHRRYGWYKALWWLQKRGGSPRTLSGAGEALDIFPERNSAELLLLFYPCISLFSSLSPRVFSKLAAQPQRGGGM